MSKKFLRPPPSYNDDSEEESEEEEALSDDDDDDDAEDDESASQAKSSKRRKLSSSGGGSGGPAKKKKSAPNFFDEEAEASDDDDDEEEEHTGHGETMDADALEIIRQQDRRRAAAGGRFGDRSVAEISHDIEQRHRMQHRTVDRNRILDRPAVSAGGRASAAASRAAASRAVAAAARDDDVDDMVDVGGGMAEEGGPEIYTAVAQQSLVPSVSDPSLWMVSCPTGKEQDYVFQLMNKCTAFARQGRPLGISAAIAAQSKGKIYIESFSEPAVMEAIQGVRGLMGYTMKLVPINDMTTVMTVVSKKKPVQKNEWVRMTRGHYKGDLAVVKAVKESGLKCIVQCVPRLDLTLADLPPEEARVRRRNIRPPQKFFNPQEIAALGRQSLRRQRFPGLDIFCDYFEGNYYHDGYLLKEMTVGSMIKPCGDEDPPTLDELQGFQRRQPGKTDDAANDGEENEGAKLAASLLDELSQLQGKTSQGKSGSAVGGLLIGDTVEVTEGDLVGMRGKLVSLDGTTVKVKPTTAVADLPDEIEFLAAQVRKYIAVGSHVKVTTGRYANETGVVVAVEQLEGDTDFTAVVLTDVTNKEISVRTSQLRESAEVASGQDKLQGYELYDLVVLSGGGSANEVGVIVRVGREDFTVVNNHGIAREVRPEELRGKRNSTSNRAVALDVQGNQIRCNDSVNVAEGPHKGKTATIKRMSRAQLFLHSQTRSEHAGIFVVRSRSCVLAGTRSQNRRGGGDAGGSPFATPQSQGSGRGGGHGGGGRGKREDGLVGKSVRIQAGNWKGYLGTVCDATATHVQVELHSRLKKVMVVRERVAVVGDKFGATSAGDDQNQPPSTVGGGIAAAPNTMATPMHAIGGATPAIHGFGGATPAHGESENTDEVWRPGGSIDQESNDAASASVKDDGWGSTSNDASGFGQGGNEDNDDGWGASGGTVASTWGATKEESNGTTFKQEQPKSEMEDDVRDGEESPKWFMERVCVQLKSNEKAAVIKEINPDKTALIELEDDKSTMTVRASELNMVVPKEHDRVLVAGGNEIGLDGTMVCVDGSDAILKDNNDEFKIIDFVHLVKIVQDS